VVRAEILNCHGMTCPPGASRLAHDTLTPPELRTAPFRIAMTLPIPPSRPATPIHSAPTLTRADPPPNCPASPRPPAVAALSNAEFQHLPVGREYPDPDERPDLIRVALRNASLPCDPESSGAGTTPAAAQALDIDETAEEAPDNEALLPGRPQARTGRRANIRIIAEGALVIGLGLGVSAFLATRPSHASARFTEAWIAVGVLLALGIYRVCQGSNPRLDGMFVD